LRRTASFDVLSVKIGLNNYSWAPMARWWKLGKPDRSWHADAEVKSSTQQRNSFPPTVRCYHVNGEQRLAPGTACTQTTSLVRVRC